MKLRQINRILRRLGLVLVVAVDAEGKHPTELWVERTGSYIARCGVPDRKD